MKKIPLLPVRNTVVFPSTSVFLVIGRDKSIAALKASKKRGGQIVISSQKSGYETQEEIHRENINLVGTLCQVRNISGNDKSGYQILVTGLSRFKINKITVENNHLMAKGMELPDNIDNSVEGEALFNNVKILAEEVLEIMPESEDSLTTLLSQVDKQYELVYLCASYLKFELVKMQELLEIDDIKIKMKIILEGMRREKEVLLLEKDIKEKVGKRLTGSQRETLLREQLKTIREELGESNHVNTGNLRNRIEEAGLPEDVFKIVMEEFNRLEGLHSSSTDYHVIRNYIDWICNMPWNTSSQVKIDLEKSEMILEKHHYGLKKIKKRILEHLAVTSLKGNLKGPIICLLGPPGVGKTSLGRSIAKALGREFVHASLGGIRDESEIRGHRRTYVGSMPGKIIQSLKRAGVNNPLMLLDEIDKLGSGIQGDPASALLEVLDPEQNNIFVDHYLDVPFDLSQVFFVATANRADTIPGPLRDRIEMIELSSYTLNEKINIAKKFIVPKTLEENGLNKDEIEINDDIYVQIVENYTREAGLRELKRTISSLCRSIAYEIVKGCSTPIVIDKEALTKYLGTQKFLESKRLRKWIPGMATGLAWTPVGGDVLYLECVKMAGNGRLQLTGQLGDVMRESAELALSFVKSHLNDLDPDFNIEAHDIHLHVPAGAISKDGPSAGITMLTAIASLVSGVIVPEEIGMTGELTLSGSILPIGGLKEKVIAGHRQKLKRIIFPSQNNQDLEDIPDEIKNELEFYPVDCAGEVLDLVLNIKLHNHERIQYQKNEINQFLS